MTYHQQKAGFWDKFKLIKMNRTHAVKTRYSPKNVPSRALKLFQNMPFSTF